MKTRLLLTTCVLALPFTAYAQMPGQAPSSCDEVGQKYGAIIFNMETKLTDLQKENGALKVQVQKLEKEKQAKDKPAEAPKPEGTK